MRRNFSPFAAFALAAVFLVVVAACGSGDVASPTSTGEGTVSGTVSIGPLCPVEPCDNAPNPYTGIEAVVSTTTGQVVSRLPLEANGGFSGVLPAGNYSLVLEPCEFLGCAFELPRSVSITDAQQTVIEIDIDTGIR